MGFSGNGTFTVTSTGWPIVNGQTSSATVMNDQSNEVATGLSTCVTKDGQTTTTAVVPFAAGISVESITNGAGLAHGTYTPTFTGITNITSVAQSGAGAFRYMRVGNTVHVSGQVNLNATAGASTATGFRITLPIASTLASDYLLNGVAAGPSGVPAGQIDADTSGNRARIQFLASASGAQLWAVIFQYPVI